ncbi:MAG: hypothetical protein M1834_002321 [Cirrosporium novae-zelandiae]|nr:MAG: hypothetical protein M1834_002321 [Cirrosporium novae-zelandiae]
MAAGPRFVEHVKRVLVKTPPKDLKPDWIALSTKPSANLSYFFIQGRDYPIQKCLAVFINGLLLPQAQWRPIMVSAANSDAGHPAMLSYDRYGQFCGLTRHRDPADKGKTNPEEFHDMLDVVRDMRQLIIQVADTKMGIPESDIDSLEIVLVAASIGCSLARIYAHEYPGTVSGLLLLDPLIANSNYDYLPNPDAEGFDLDKLPADIAALGVDELREQRRNMMDILHSTVENPEGTNLRTQIKLLPHSDGPKLVGPRKGTPALTIAAHDPQMLAYHAEKSRGIPAILTRTYTCPIWHQYYLAQLKLTDEDLAKGPVVAKGCGHFINAEDPEFTTKEFLDLLDRLLIKTE